MQGLKQYHLAKHCFEQALHLINYQDASFIENYRYFTNEYLKNSNTLKYVSEIDDLFGPGYEQRHCDVNKVIIYDYEVITYDKREIISNNRDLNTEEIIGSFGGKDRVNTLKNHWQEMLSLSSKLSLVILVSCEQDYNYKYKEFKCM